jgi:hypothetical protein
MNDNDILLTEAVFEASKVVAVSLARARAFLYFPGHAKCVSIRGGAQSLSARGERASIKIVIGSGNEKVERKYRVSQYMQLSWDDVKDIIPISKEDNTMVNEKQIHEELMEEYKSKARAYESIYNNTTGLAQDKAWQEMMLYFRKIDDLVRLARGGN